MRSAVIKIRVSDEERKQLASAAGAVRLPLLSAPIEH